MEITYTLAGQSDLPVIWELYQAGIRGLLESGIFQWDALYPDQEILAEDVKKGEMYLGWLGEQLACAYVLNQECDPEYADGMWQYPGEPFRVVHRLCVDPACQGQGVGGQTMQHIEEMVRAAGVRVIRLDVFSRNPKALTLYENLGYCRVGHADWRKGRFYLMEKGLL